MHGSHSIRAQWGAIFAMGLTIFRKGLKPETARSTTLVIALVFAGLIVSRLIGVFVNGTDGFLKDQYSPLFIESIMAVLGSSVRRQII